MTRLALALSLLLGFSTRQMADIAADDRIAGVLKHPAFVGFGRLMLPWDDREYDDTIRIRDIAALLPYHTHVNADVTVSALNRLIADAAAGKTVFYDIYTGAQKQSAATRANTGLFFFRGALGAPFAVIAPGGGFSYVASVHEGFPYAVEINKRGYNAFVLKYRVGQGGTVATQDLAAAVSYIFRNASALGVSTNAYSLWGSSAGARMAATIGAYGVGRFGAPTLPKPSAVVMAYTGHAAVGSDDPATFVVVGDRDVIAPSSTMEQRVALLRRGGTDVEYQSTPASGMALVWVTGTQSRRMDRKRCSVLGETDRTSQRMIDQQQRNTSAIRRSPVRSERFSTMCRSGILAGVTFTALFGATDNAVAQALKDVQTPDTPLVLKAQGSFFVGGDKVEQTRAEVGNLAPGGQIAVNQMYVRYMVPQGGDANVPVVMVHGATLTGKSWETTPDGRMGWDRSFVRKGHPVYVPTRSDAGGRVSIKRSSTTCARVQRQLPTSPSGSASAMKVSGRTSASA